MLVPFFILQLDFEIIYLYALLSEDLTVLNAEVMKHNSSLIVFP